MNLINAAMKVIAKRARTIGVYGNKPSIGDFISVDWAGRRPGDFKDQEINWFCSEVIGIHPEGGKYKVTYDDGAKWYHFGKFGTSRSSKFGRVYPAIRPE